MMLTVTDNAVVCNFERKLLLSTTGLQTDCLATVPAPMVILPDSHVYALWL